MSDKEKRSVVKQAIRQESIRLIWIYAFVAIIEHGSFAAAGRAMKVDESTVREYVGALEKWFGRKLFFKKRRFELSPFGHDFTHKARGVIELLEEARNYDTPVDRIFRRTNSDIENGVRSVKNKLTGEFTFLVD